MQHVNLILFTVAESVFSPTLQESRETVSLTKPCFYIQVHENRYLFTYFSHLSLSMFGFIASKSFSVDVS